MLHATFLLRRFWPTGPLSAWLTLSLSSTYLSLWAGSSRATGRFGWWEDLVSPRILYHQPFLWICGFKARRSEDCHRYDAQWLLWKSTLRSNHVFSKKMFLNTFPNLQYCQRQWTWPLARLALGSTWSPWYPMSLGFSLDLCTGECLDLVWCQSFEALLIFLRVSVSVS